jgi:tripartite-type tricarboxylate transporter receptor subunit TctC
MLSLNKALAAMAVTLCAGYATAAETIQIIWGFNPGSNQANTVRHIIAEANKIQKKYEFQFVSKPGAGGHIAATEVAKNPQNSIVSMSSTFFIRPYFEKGSPVHDLDQFTPVLVQGVGAPLIFVSKNYDSIEAAMKAPKLTVGVSGIGSISHLAANELVLLNKNITVVNFKNMIDATTAAAGGHVDMAVSFYIDAKGLIDAREVKVIGRTGSRDVGGTDISKIGAVDAARLTANFAIFASREMAQDRLVELHQILNKAHVSAVARESYEKDQLTVMTLDTAKSRDWYADQRKLWKTLVEKIDQRNLPK